jgi:hypothetical protein
VGQERKVVCGVGGGYEGLAGTGEQVEVGVHPACRASDLRDCGGLAVNELAEDHLQYV